MSSGGGDGALAAEVAKYYADPLGFVLAMFPWGEAGTQLAQYNGPRKWQWDYLNQLGEQIRARGFDGVTAVDPIQIATASGHGIGKSALTAWIILFIMSTRPHAKGVVTANTSDQLRTKTWAELGRWHKLCATRQWFSYSAARGNLSLVSGHYPETWRVDAMTCREEQAESFAGLHAANSTPFYIFDEASAVPDVIWEVSDGGLTDGEPMRLVFGNPTRNSGKFFECFNRNKHRWLTNQIDSRHVAGTNKELFAQWVSDYGEDSDFVRVRVRGVFPRAGSMQFIGSDIVRAAMANNHMLYVYDHMPRVLGVDVARFGDDQSVIVRRQGRKVWPLRKFRGMDTMALANAVVEEIRAFAPAATFVDGIGVGAGVVDRLRQLGYNVIDVQSGARANDGVLYRNKRAEMWGNMRVWLQEDGPDLPDDRDLESALTGLEYGYTVGGQIQLESKQDAKARGLASPDEADAIAMTFAEPIAVDAGRAYATGQTDYDLYGDQGNTAQTEYDLYG